MNKKTQYYCPCGALMFFSKNQTLKCVLCDREIEHKNGYFSTVKATVQSGIVSVDPIVEEIPGIRVASIAAVEQCLLLCNKSNATESRIDHFLDKMLTIWEQQEKELLK